MSAAPGPPAPDPIRDALQRIANYDAATEAGYLDEWVEANAFHRCQAIAREALEAGAVDPAPPVGPRVIPRPSADEMVAPDGPCYCTRCMEARGETFAPAVCAHAFDSMICVAPAGHDGAHVTSNERFPHGLQRLVPGAPPAARIAPTDAMIDAATQEMRTLTRGPGEDRGWEEIAAVIVRAALAAQSDPGVRPA